MNTQNSLWHHLVTASKFYVPLKNSSCNTVPILHSQQKLKGSPLPKKVLLRTHSDKEAEPESRIQWCVIFTFTSSYSRRVWDTGSEETAGGMKRSQWVTQLILITVWKKQTTRHSIFDCVFFFFFNISVFLQDVYASSFYVHAERKN